MQKEGNQKKSDAEGGNQKDAYRFGSKNVEKERETKDAQGFWLKCLGGFLEPPINVHLLAVL